MMTLTVLDMIALRLPTQRAQDSGNQNDGGLDCRPRGSHISRRWRPGLRILLHAAQSCTTTPCHLTCSYHPTIYALAWDIRRYYMRPFTNIIHILQTSVEFIAPCKYHQTNRIMTSPMSVASEACPFPLLSSPPYNFPPNANSRPANSTADRPNIRKLLDMVRTSIDANVNLSPIVTAANASSPDQE